MIRQLSDLQSDIRELLAQARGMKDQTMEEQLVADLGHKDEAVIATTLALRETSKNEEPIEYMDLMKVGEFLDHLDTQGYEVRRKKR